MKTLDESLDKVLLSKVTSDVFLAENNARETLQQYGFMEELRSNSTLLRHLEKMAHNSMCIMLVSQKHVSVHLMELMIVYLYYGICAGVEMEREDKWQG